MRLLLAITLLAGIAVAAPVPKAVKKKDDKALLVGAWKVSGVTVNGKPAHVTYHTFVFTADGKLTLLRGPAAAGGPQWTWTVDPAASPRTMSWAAPNPWDCVYDLDGDTLKLGLLNPGATPPAMVEPGDGLTLYEMTRDTSAK